MPVGEEVVRRVDVRPGLGAHGHVEHVVSVAVDRGRGAELRNGITRVNLRVRTDRMRQVENPPYLERHAGGSFIVSGAAGVSCATGSSRRLTFEPSNRLSTR